MHSTSAARSAWHFKRWPFNPFPHINTCGTATRKGPPAPAPAHRSDSESSGCVWRKSSWPDSDTAGMTAVILRGPRLPMMLYSYATVPSSCRSSVYAALLFLPAAHGGDDNR